MALKARLLYDFFYKPLPEEGALNESDLRALDFLHDWNAPACGDAWDAARKWSNKHLAHLTLDRLSNKPQWPITEITRDCLYVFSTFLTKLPSHLLSAAGAKFTEARKHAAELENRMPETTP